MTQRVLRIFIRPTGDKWLDLPLGNATVQNWLAMIRTEGCCVCDHWMVPYDAILYAVTYQVEGGQVTPLYPIDGGRAS